MNILTRQISLRKYHAVSCSKIFDSYPPTLSENIIGSMCNENNTLHKMINLKNKKLCFINLDRLEMVNVEPVSENLSVVFSYFQNYGSLFMSLC